MSNLKLDILWEYLGNVQLLGVRHVPVCVYIVCVSVYVYVSVCL